MKRKLLIFGIPAAALICLILYFRGSGQTPPQQPPLANLTPQNFDQFRKTFNDSSDSIRVLALLSPT